MHKIVKGDLTDINKSLREFKKELLNMHASGAHLGKAQSFPAGSFFRDKDELIKHLTSLAILKWRMDQMIKKQQETQNVNIN